jgi:hypothetical protein
MEAESSLSCTQDHATGLYPEPYNPVHILTPYFFKINFNIILPSTPRSPKRSLHSHFRNKLMSAFLPSVLHVLHISPFLTLLP